MTQITGLPIKDFFYNRSDSSKRSPLNNTQILVKLANVLETTTKIKIFPLSISECNADVFAETVHKAALDMSLLVLLHDNQLNSYFYIVLRKAVREVVAA